MSKPIEPFDRWHKRYPKPERGDVPCQCGTQHQPLYPSADHGRGHRWQARYTDYSGKEKRPAFATWREARGCLDKVLAEAERQTSRDNNPGSLQVEYFATEMMTRRRKRKKNTNTCDTYESHLRNHILPFVDHLLDKQGIDSACTVVQIFKTWRILMHYMLDEDVPLPPNIVARIDLPDVMPRVKVALSPGQVAAVAAAMRRVAPRYEALIWLGACAGLRQGEAFGLKRSQVAWKHDLLHIEEQRQRGKAVRLKTKASYATLPVDRFLIERLIQHVSRFSEPEPVSPGAERRRRARGYVEPPDEGLIVTNRLGRPVLHSDFHQKWRRAVKQAGLPDRTRFHDLKHFYTTTLGSSGKHDPKTSNAHDLWIGLGLSAKGVPSRVIDFWSSSRPT
ncbi:tyrosine-type recombinase/integrase, partial [Streptomyces sp. NPDC096057]|uniref:tyrosine-type recombinase/integrase n=1 Tax=Streptomyces sp. NPDC096057 TaxID=3155543 RepID=UPI00332FEE4B